MNTSSLLAPSTNQSKQRVVCEDLAALRSLLERIKRSDQLAPLHLFGRKKTTTMLAYLDQRVTYRDSIRIPMFVTPTTFDGYKASIPGDDAETTICITENVSLKGLGFSHESPMDFYHATISFDVLDAFTSLLLEIRWRNVETDHDLLITGGKFVGILD